MRTILVVEDEPQIAGLVRDYLEHAGFAVIAAGDGAAALALVRARRPDALVLDLGLPRVDGLDVIRAIRRDSRVPILILSARGDETDRVAGLELGADDYVVKPFSPRELVARVRAVLRRAEAVPLADERIEAGDLELDLVRRRVTVAGRAVTLTPTEFELLATLAREPGRVWTRSQLLDAVHGFSLETYERAIDGHIRNLRRKLEPDDAVAALRPHGPRRGLRPGRSPTRDDDRRDAPGAAPSRWGEPSRRRGRGPGRGRRRRDASAAWSSALVLLVGLVSTLATWVAASLLGFLAPSATPSAVTAVAVLVVLVARDPGGDPRLRLGRPAARARSPTPPSASRTASPGVRVRVRGPRPVRGLAASFNTMAERLDRSRDDRRAMLADVTHELRTPITVVQGGLEAMLDGVHPYDEDHVAPLLAETAVMGRLLDDLRTLSLADAARSRSTASRRTWPASRARSRRSRRTVAAAKGVAARGDR